VVSTCDDWSLPDMRKASPTTRQRALRRARILLRRRGWTAAVWRRRVAIMGGAILVGLAAISFAWTADRATQWFDQVVEQCWWSPLVMTPMGYALTVWLTNRLAPAARGSGIPQIIAAKRDPANATADLASARTAVFKAALTAIALAVGGSVGREGPTVQLGATIMAYAHKWLRVPINASVLVAGAAAGVAAAFNTPLAGVAFAIEELAAAYEQRMTLLVMTAVLIAGMIAQGVAGDYVYFGIVGETLPLRTVLIVAPIAGGLGGLGGGLFARMTLWFARGGARRISGGRPLIFAACSGLVVAMLGIATDTTWGTGYGAARAIIEGDNASLWFGPAKLISTLVTAAAGLPGGIFAPSLATGAGLGNVLHALFPAQPTGALVLLAMVGYFTGVVRAPLTAVIIMAEATGSRGLMLPLLATALIAEAAAGLICRERLYHGLSSGFLRPGST